MPDWFTPLVIILALAALALFVAFWTTRRRKYVAGVGVALALIVVAYLIARFVPTERKAIESAIEDMAAGVRNRNPNQVFSHFAKDFRYRSMDKKQFEDAAGREIRRGIVSDIMILDYDKVEISKAAKRADLEFRVKPIGGVSDNTMFYVCRARFVLEEDGKWRMQTFDLYYPLGENRAVDIPGVN
jgi:hypothetical protein